MMENSVIEPLATGKDEQEPSFKRVAECLWRHSHTGRYYALVKRHGKQHRKSLATADRQLAERRLAEFRRTVARLGTPQDKRITFMELAKNWLDGKRGRLKQSSVEQFEVGVRQLNKHFGTLPVREITPSICHEWEKKRGEKIGASAFNLERSILIAVLNFAIRESLLLENPAVVISRRKISKSKIVIPSTEQFDLLVKTMRAGDRRAWTAADLVELLAYSGMRVAEATAMTWGEVDFSQGRFTVSGGIKGTKNGEVRIVPLFPAMRSLLERLRNGAVPNPTERVIPITTAQKAIDGACKKAGLPRFHHHLFRHFFVSQAIEAGIDFKTIASWVGHKDGGLLVAKTYGHLRDTHSFEMAKKMTFDCSLHSQSNGSSNC